MYSHTAKTQKIMDLVGDDIARVWVPFILTELAQPSLPYEVRKEMGSKIGNMNEPDNDRLMKVPFATWSPW